MRPVNDAPSTQAADRLAGLRGTFPSQAIEALIAAGAIRSDAGVLPRRVQPASLDLTLSAEAWQVPGSILPLRSEGVRDLIAAVGRRQLDLSEPTLLDRDKVYLIRLQERLALRRRQAFRRQRRTMDLREQLRQEGPVRLPRRSKLNRHQRGVRSSPAGSPSRRSMASANARPMARWQRALPR